MFEIISRDSNSRARVGRFTTPHGVLETPSYVIVGTHGAIRSLESEDIPLTKTQIVIANTYHLWRILDEEINNFPGLHAYMEWNGPIMTDSGGFQVFSLGFSREHGLRGYHREGSSHIKENKSHVRITAAGVYFQPDDSRDEELYLDAETSIKIQEQLGADLIVAFDEATAPGLDYKKTKAAMERTHRWAGRSLEAKTSSQLIYGVVQGGAFEDLRKESARIIGAMPFGAFGIGSTYGDGFGGTKAKTEEILDWAIPLLPDNRPRHLFGVGYIDDILSGVSRGIDTFDCVIPTREGRHGGIWTQEGRIDILKGKYRDDDNPLDATCFCFACKEEGMTKQNLHLLFKGKNFSAGRLATLHNIYFFNTFMEEIRASIAEGRFSEFRKEYLARMHRGKE